MRLSTTIQSALQHPDGDHDDDDGHELHEHTQPHELLRGLRRTALHHVDEAEHQHDSHRDDRDGHEGVIEELGHGLIVLDAGMKGAWIKLSELPSSTAPSLKPCHQTPVLRGAAL